MGLLITPELETISLGGLYNTIINDYTIIYNVADLVGSPLGMTVIPTTQQHG